MNRINGRIALLLLAVLISLPACKKGSNPSGPKENKTPTHTATTSLTPTLTTTASLTGTPTFSATATATITTTSSPTNSLTPTPSHTPSHTYTHTPTPTPSSTDTSTHSLTPTATSTPTASLTQTDTSTPTETLTPTETHTPTNTACLSNCISTAAGLGSVGFTGDGGQAVSARFNYPIACAKDGQGGYWVSDYANHRIRRVDASGAITTVVGTGTYGYNGDGISATLAQVNYPAGIVSDYAGGFYFADSMNHRVRHVDPLGNITTVAGTGTGGYNGDGITATAAQLNRPMGVAVDINTDDLYITEYEGYRVRRVSGGIISTVAGDGSIGSGGDNGPATLATLNGPMGIDVNTAGEIYISEYTGHRVRKVSGVTITTVAGTGTGGYNGDGIAATAAQLNNPAGVFSGGSGKLYITDSSNHLVRRVDSGVITTVAGTGNWGYNGDNINATLAQIYYPMGVMLDGVSGGFMFVEMYGQRVRRVTP